MATLFFNQDGSLKEFQTTGQDKAYIETQEVPFILGSQLQAYSAIVYAEAAGQALGQKLHGNNYLQEMQKETFAMAYTMYTYAMEKRKKTNGAYGLINLLNDKNYVHGLGTTGYQEYLRGSGGDEARRRCATLAVIKLFARHLQGPLEQQVIQQLQGAAWWDGADLFTRFQAHYRAQMGFELSNSQHGYLYQNHNGKVISTIPAQNQRVISAGRQFTFLSTITAGGSIFFKLHPQAIQQGVGV